MHTLKNSTNTLSFDGEFLKQNRNAGSTISAIKQPTLFLIIRASVCESNRCFYILFELITKTIPHLIHHRSRSKHSKLKTIHLAKQQIDLNNPEMKQLMELKI